VRIGLISDTHGYFDERLTELLSGVDAILHAGDVGSQDVLERLALIAPTRAVKGNADPAVLGLPLSLSFEAEGVSIEVLHILPASQTQLQAWTRAGPKSDALKQRRFAEAFSPAARVVVFGHSHQPGIYSLEDRLFINPGSAGRQRFSLPRRFAAMEVTPGAIEVKLMPLKDYNKNASESMTWHWEGSPHAHVEKH
jgi:putative phosphoesterase